MLTDSGHALDFTIHQAMKGKKNKRMLQCIHGITNIGYFTGVGHFLLLAGEKYGQKFLLNIAFWGMTLKFYQCYARIKKVLEICMLE